MNIVGIARARFAGRQIHAEESEHADTRYEVVPPLMGRMRARVQDRRRPRWRAAAEPAVPATPAAGPGCGHFLMATDSNECPALPYERKHPTMRQRNCPRIEAMPMRG
jgi:hypothetical protein